MTTEQTVSKGGKRLIIVLSVAVPVLVAVLLFLPTKVGVDAEWVRSLPHANAIINSLTAVFLLAAYLAIRSGNIELHKKLMLGAITLGALFLISYVVYHGSVEGTKFGDLNNDGVLSDAELSAAGNLRTIYFVILLSHILLSLVVLPFVLFAAYYGLNGLYTKHKRIVRFAFPIWLYVSISGVVVYLMIRPFYG